MILGVEDDFFHCADSLDWIGTVGGLIRQHNDVGALHDGGGNIGNLGAGWFWVVYHG